MELGHTNTTQGLVSVCIVANLLILTLPVLLNQKRAQEAVGVVVSQTPSSAPSNPRCES